MNDFEIMSIGFIFIAILIYIRRLFIIRPKTKQFKEK